MTARHSVVILSAGGTALDAMDFLDDLNAEELTYHCLGFLDDDPARQGTSFAGLPILGKLESIERWPDVLVVDALGSPGSHRRRPDVIGRLLLAPERFLTLVHPTARVSRRSRLGPGCLLYPHVVIGANVTLGAHVTILANTVVNHDSTIGDYSILTSSVGVAGRVRIGRACYVGTGAQIIHDASIGDGALVGMGAVVIRDVSPGATVVGNPARVLR